MIELDKHFEVQQVVAGPEEKEEKRGEGDDTSQDSTGKGQHSAGEETLK